MKNRHIIVSVALIALSAVLVACGGGGGDSGGGGGGSTAVITKGVMTKGSVIVNGVRFDDSAAQIRREDDIVTMVTATTLDDGMMVTVKGKRNDDGVTGTAEKIEVENEVRGTVTSVGTGTFGVLGQTVIVNSATVTAGGWSYNEATGAITGLIVSDFVEVHGDRNAAGAILASRVEKFGAAGVDELRGIVSGLTGTLPDAAAFSVSGFAIVTNGSTTIVPAGATIANGSLVEVHLTGGNTATRIEVEDAEDVEFEPAEGEEVEVEGLVANFDNVSDFDISGTHVHTTASTRYEGGIFGDIADDVKVEVEGHMSGGVLVASKVKFGDTIRIEANATATGPLVALGRTIYTTAGTEIVNGPILGGDGLRIRGFQNGDGSITATSIEKLGSAVATGNEILQGPVSAKNEGAKTLTIIGITVDLSTVPANEIKDDSDNIITLAQFYASITLNRTEVKVRGSYSAGTMTAGKAELE